MTELDARRFHIVLNVAEAVRRDLHLAAERIVEGEDQHDDQRKGHGDARGHQHMHPEALHAEKIRERDNDYRFAPFWLKFSFKKITQRIKTLDPEQIWGFGHYFNDRYRRNIFPELYPEKKFVIDLLAHIDRPTKNRKRKNLRNASLDYLSKCLYECEQNFPET